MSRKDSVRYARLIAWEIDNITGAATRPTEHAAFEQWQTGGRIIIRAGWNNTVRIIDGFLGKRPQPNRKLFKGRRCPHCKERKSAEPHNWRQVETLHGIVEHCRTCCVKGEIHGDLRQCSHCGVYKPLSTVFWHRDNKGRHGLKTICKNCLSHYNRRRYSSRQAITGR